MISRARSIGMALLFGGTHLSMLLADEPPAGSGIKPRDYASFLRELTNLDRLPHLVEGVWTKQASSYNRESKYDPTTDTYVRWDAGGDSGKYERTDFKKQSVMADIKGPGCVYRLWAANPKGKIRFFLDGDPSPLEYDFKELFSGKIPPFVSPLVWQGNDKSGVCYLPIPFARSIIITADRSHDQQYAISYKIFPADTQLHTFHVPLSKSGQKALNETIAIWNKKGEPEPVRIAPDGRGENSVALPPGQEIPLLTLDGPATITELRTRLDSPSKHAGRKVLLKIYWDGEEQPSVDAPLGDFFGASFGGKPYQSLPLGITADGGYCYWRMPFRKSARIVALNEGESPAKVTLRAVAQPGNVPKKAGYFHAKWRRERACASLDYPILVAAGQGKLVGAALFVDNLHGGWWGEGDEKAWVDGEVFPSVFGVSTDGFFGQGGNQLRTADHALVGAQETGRATSAYRWFLGDSISFNQSFRLTIENTHWLSKEKNDYASMAYWYAAAGAKDFFKPTVVADRLPQPPRMEKEAFEAETVMTTRERIVEDEAFSHGKAVAISGHRGKRARFAISVPSDEQYLVEVSLGPKTDASAFEILPENGNHPIGPKLALSAGPHELVVRLTRDVPAATPVVLDFLRVGPWHNFVQEWLVIGPFDNTGDKHFDTAYPPEQELAFDKRHDGKAGKVGWSPARASLKGHVNFLELLPPPHNDAIAYAATTLIAPTGRSAEILLGSDDAVKLWVNGTLVHNNHKHRGAAPDQDRVPVQLKAGPNTLLIKVDQGGGDWGFYLRPLDENQELKNALPPHPAPTDTP